MAEPGRPREDLPVPNCADLDLAGLRGTPSWGQGDTEGKGEQEFEVPIGTT